MVIKSDGLVLVGAGSEWFWSMLQFVIVAATLVGIYHQLRVARSANAFAHLKAVEEQWRSELMLRKRLAVLLALRDGTALSDLPWTPAIGIADYWETVGSLVRAGHIAPTTLAESFGRSCEFWWPILAPKLLQLPKIPTPPSTSTSKRPPRGCGKTVPRAFDQAKLDSHLESFITSVQTALRDLEAMRTVIVVSPASNAATAGRPDGPTTRRAVPRPERRGGRERSRPPLLSIQSLTLTGHQSHVVESLCSPGGPWRSH